MNVILANKASVLYGSGTIKPLAHIEMLKELISVRSVPFRVLIKALVLLVNTVNLHVG